MATCKVSQIIGVAMQAELDTLQDRYVEPKWTDVTKTRFPYSHGRPLPNEVAQKAIDYINVIAKQYPFQIRYTMVLPLWKRFAETWCETGDVEKSMRVI